MERKSNFELYRIVCIFVIVMMHTFGNGMGTFNSYLGILVNVIGNIGVTGFVLLSGYFGIKLNIKKLVKLDILMITWSLAYLIAVYFFGGGAAAIGMKDILSSFIPVSSHRYWFLSAYFCLCILSPFINEYLDKITKERHLKLIITAGVLFLILPTLVGFDQTGDGGKGVVNMILSYITGRYLGKYQLDIKISKSRLAAVFAGTMALSFVLNAGFFMVTGSTANYYARDNSIFTMILAVSLLLIFRDLKIKNSFINKAAANVVAVYVLEDTIKLVVMNYLPYNSEQYITSVWYVAVVIVVTVITFIAGTLLEAVRKIIFAKLEDTIINKIGNKVALWKK